MSASRLRPFALPVIALFTLTCLSPLKTATGQSLASRLSWLRTQEIAREYYSQNGRRMFSRPMEALGVKTDSIRMAILAARPSEEEPPAKDNSYFPITSLQTIALEEIDQFRHLFENTEWAFLGNTSFVQLDTMLTREIRARMQFHFGPPTRTVAESEPRWRPDSTDVLQFEYWFLVNENIPAYVIDINGPWDRGVVVAVPSEYRSVLSDFKLSLLRQLVSANDRMPFADYYYNMQQEMWYVTLYDGASFFDVRIERPDPESGRPRLEDFNIRALNAPR